MVDVNLAFYSALSHLNGSANLPSMSGKHGSNTNDVKSGMSFLNPYYQHLT